MQIPQRNSMTANENPRSRVATLIATVLMCIGGFGKCDALATVRSRIRVEPPGRGVFSVGTSRLAAAATSEAPDASDSHPLSTRAFVTKSGRPVSRYGLGGAARSTQPESLPRAYVDMLQSDGGDDAGAPFFFYYNPHRYPAFLSGVKSIAESNDGDGTLRREDVFIASGGSDRSLAALDERLNDALAHCGGSYLDAFVLEYIVMEELIPVKAAFEEPNMLKRLGLSPTLAAAIEHVQSYVDEGKVRCVWASTHSHVAGNVLANARSASTEGEERSLLDGLMLRYNPSHKDAAEAASLPAALYYDIPVIAFTTTRWNRLQEGRADWEYVTPDAADCLRFALHHPAVEAVLHSARDEEDLSGSLGGLLERDALTEVEEATWRMYGDLAWNDDAFDDYPEEKFLKDILA